MKVVEVRGDFITLGQLLKVAGIIGTGGAARDYLESTSVNVNGGPENRRGRKLLPGDRVVIEGEEIELVPAGASPGDSSPSSMGSSGLSPGLSPGPSHELSFGPDGQTWYQAAAVPRIRTKPRRKKRF